MNCKGTVHLFLEGSNRTSGKKAAKLVGLGIHVIYSDFFKICGPYKIMPYLLNNLNSVPLLQRIAFSSSLVFMWNANTLRASRLRECRQ